MTATRARTSLDEMKSRCHMDFPARHLEWVWAPPLTKERAIIMNVSYYSYDRKAEIQSLQAQGSNDMDSPFRKKNDDMETWGAKFDLGNITNLTHNVSAYVASINSSKARRAWRPTVIRINRSSEHQRAPD